MTEYKGYGIVTEGFFLHKKIVSPGQGGGLPNQLKGLFTNETFAKQAIDYYLTIKQEIEDRPPPVKKVKLTPRG